MSRKRNDADDVPLTSGQEAIATQLVDRSKDPVNIYLRADRQADETPAQWLARRFAYDLEVQRQRLDELSDASEKAKAASLMVSVAQTRKIQMEIIARAAELEQRKTEDASMADAFRLMAARYPKDTSRPAAEAMAMTRREKAAAWKAGTLARE